MDGPGVVILNPVAAQGRIRRQWPQIEAAITGVIGKKPDVWVSQRPGHATDLAKRAALEGYTWVAVCGGDGSVHEVVNGLFSARAPHSNISDAPALIVIPAGTGNDFARSLGMPINALQVVSGLSDPVADVIDIGQVGKYYFANIGGAGFDAEVAADVNRKGIKTGGALPYVLSVLKKMIVYENQDIQIVLDGKVIERRSLLVAVGIMPYYAGGMHILPGADPQDGLLDVCVCGDLGKLQILSLLPRIFSGGHVGHPLVEFYRAKTVRIQGPSRLHVQADGEIVGNLPIEFRCLPKALKIIKPSLVSEKQQQEWQGNISGSQFLSSQPQSRAWPPN